MHPAIRLRPVSEVSTARLTAVGLLGGYLLGRESGIRPLGGVLMGAAGAAAARAWYARGGVRDTALLTTLYVGAAKASHHLYPRIGVWPAVATVTTAAVSASYVVSDRRAAGSEVTTR